MSEDRLETQTDKAVIDKETAEENQTQERPEESRTQERPLYTEQVVEKFSMKHKKMSKRRLLLLGTGCIAVVLIVALLLLKPILLPWLSRKVSAETSDIKIESDKFPDAATPTTAKDSGSSQVDISEASSDSEGNMNYDTLLRGLQENVGNIEKSMVLVDHTRDSISDYLSVSESGTDSKTAGVVIGKSSFMYVILTELSAIEDINSIVIKFPSGAQVDGAFLGSSTSAGIALVSVPQAMLTSEEKSQIEPISLGNSYKVKQGSMVLTYGRVHGENDSVDYGMITSVSDLSMVDNDCAEIKTNISHSADDFAFLFNGDGNLIGISETENTSMFSYLGISDLKLMISQICNGRGSLYFGIKGQNVTKDLAGEYSLPEGIYVSSVEYNSPAYTAGIQPGDVIVSLEDAEVTTLRSFHERLYKYSKGQTVPVVVKRLGKGVYSDLQFNVVLSEEPKEVKE